MREQQVEEEEGLRFPHKNKINKSEVPGEEALKVEVGGQSWIDTNKKNSASKLARFTGKQ